MPKGTKVHRCVEKKKAQGMDEQKAIKICQDATGQNYQTGEPIEGNEKGTED